MITRIVVLLIVAFLVALYFPESRATIVEHAGPVVDPVLRLSTEREMNRIANDLKTYQRENFERLPGERQFSDWIEGQYSGGGELDAWGAPYEYRLEDDKFTLRSPGPDGLRATPDDIVVTRPRRF
ncbi:MAG: hypothetical protein RQ745_06365 [Longimicrobiales bacterium]|nr:hypothetical protein [Longimicrobiales bacterium]